MAISEIEGNEVNLTVAQLTVWRESAHSGTSGGLGKPVQLPQPRRRSWAAVEPTQEAAQGESSRHAQGHPVSTLTEAGKETPVEG